MLRRVLGWFGGGGDDADGSDAGDLEWTDPDTEYGGAGPPPPIHVSRV